MTFEEFLPPIAEGWPASGRFLREKYRQAPPWPHLVLDGIVDLGRIAAVEGAELPFARNFVTQRSRRQIKAESPIPGSDLGRDLLNDLNHPDFVRFLEELTGIRNLATDPSHCWAGVHAYSTGHFQAVHRDFARHPRTRLFHRVNVLLYLNSDWDNEFGGQLELWDRDLTVCAKRIQPRAGRMVIFDTDPTTYHGIPEPLEVPPGRIRLSLASYYYTVDPALRVREGTQMRHPRRPQDPWMSGWAGPKEVLRQTGLVLRNRMKGLFRGERCHDRGRSRHG